MEYAKEFIDSFKSCQVRGEEFLDKNLMNGKEGLKLEPGKQYIKYGFQTSNETTKLYQEADYKLVREYYNSIHNCSMGWFHNDNRPYRASAPAEQHHPDRHNIRVFKQFYAAGADLVTVEELK